MPYTQIYYHIVWATKNREPYLTPEVENVVHELLRVKAIGLNGIVHALNGSTDHIHLIVSVPTNIALSKFIGQVKATASTKFNKSGHPKAPIYSQEEYSVFTIDKKRLPYHVEYVVNQKTHHAERTTIPVLEKVGSENTTM